MRPSQTPALASLVLVKTADPPGLATFDLSLALVNHMHGGSVLAQVGDGRDIRGHKHLLEPFRFQWQQQFAQPLTGRQVVELGGWSAGLECS